ncbi:MAG: DUF1801 domain-containing protein [Pseudomonadota bacterium]
MRIETRLGRFEDVIATAPQHTATLEAVRALVADLHPDAVEAASARERSVWWGHGAAKMKTGYAWCMPHKAHVNFGFFQGATLDDSDGLLEGTGKALRHVKLRGPQEVGRPALRTLLAAAIEERRAALSGQG